MRVAAIDMGTCQTGERPHTLPLHHTCRVSSAPAIHSHYTPPASRLAAAVIGTPRGNLEDPRVEFTALECVGRGGSNPNVRPTLFSLQVPSRAEQWPNAKTFIRQWPRVYRHEVFFSPLPESIKTQQLHVNPFYSVIIMLGTGKSKKRV